MVIDFGGLEYLEKKTRKNLARINFFYLYLAKSKIPQGQNEAAIHMQVWEIWSTSSPV